MKKIIQWCLNHQTNLLASLYIILVQIVAGVFHVAKIWTDKPWPKKCLEAIDKPSQWLKQFAKQKK